MLRATALEDGGHSTDSGIEDLKNELRPMAKCLQ